MAPNPIAALHAGSGEPVLLIHPFMLSPHVWIDVADKLSDEFEVFAPALSGHWGGDPRDRWSVVAETLADRLEQQLDELGWDTCHIVGNSLGGWVSLELAKRGRARSVTAIAPAGGWGRVSVAKVEIAAKFLPLGPLGAIGRLAGSPLTSNRLIHRLVLPLVSKNVGAVPRERATEMVTAASYAAVSGYLPLLIGGLTAHGLTGLEELDIPVRLLLCDPDRIIPAKRFGKFFLQHLPAGSDFITMHGIGHVPMLEDPDRVALAISEHVRASSLRVAV